MRYIKMNLWNKCRDLFSKKANQTFLYTSDDKTGSPYGLPDVTINRPALSAPDAPIATLIDTNTGTEVEKLYC